MRLRCALAAALAVLVAAATGGARTGAGPEVRVSGLEGPQTNPTIAVDPNDASILLAGSNSLLEGVQRVYSSTDGGATWTGRTTFRPPPSVRVACAADPAVAIDDTGRQYYTFDRATPCRTEGPYRVYAITRPDARSAWSSPILVAPLGRNRLDDKPTVAVDTFRESPHHGRVYVAWSRLSRRAAFSLVTASSDDGGRTWSRPVKVNRTGEELNFASLAVARDGTLYVAWADLSNFGVRIARSTDGGRTFGPEQTVANFTIVTIPHCGAGIVIPALPRGCVQPAPQVVVDTSTGPYSGRVYVTYSGTDFQGDQGTALTTFDTRLRALAGFPLRNRSRIVVPAEPGKRSDQFWPQSAVDPSNGTLWVCHYDTAGDPTRRSARYSCTISRDGGRTFARQLPVAAVYSDENRPGAIRGYGYYQGVVAQDGVAHPIWTDTRDLARLGEEIYTRAVTEADVVAAK